LEEKLKTPAKKRLDRLSQNKEEIGEEAEEKKEKEEDDDDDDDDMVPEEAPLAQHSAPVMSRQRSASMVEQREKHVVFAEEPVPQVASKPPETTRKEEISGFERASKRLFSLFESENPAPVVKINVKTEDPPQTAMISDGDQADSEAEDPFASAGKFVFLFSFSPFFFHFFFSPKKPCLLYHRVTRPVMN
jgi:hypothetical protein